MLGVKESGVKLHGSQRMGVKGSEWKDGSGYSCNRTLLGKWGRFESIAAPIRVSQKVSS